MNCRELRVVFQLGLVPNKYLKFNFTHYPFGHFEFRIGMYFWHTCTLIKEATLTIVKSIKLFLIKIKPSYDRIIIILQPYVLATYYGIFAVDTNELWINDLTHFLMASSWQGNASFEYKSSLLDTFTKAEEFILSLCLKAINAHKLNSWLNAYLFS